MKCLRLVPVVVILAAACATPESQTSQDADRTIVVTMRDIEFEPDRFTVQEGETIALRFTNRGRVTHDAFIGDEDEQQEHEEESRVAADDGMSQMNHGSGDSAAVTVKPGRSETLTYTFKRAGKTLIGCHEPGHYEGGMKVDVTVESA